MSLDQESLEVHAVASGSKGNCTIIRSAKSAFIIDAGISCRRITKALQALDIPMHMVEGIVVTHEHSDHIAGIPQMIKQWGLPIFTKAGTARRIGDKQNLPMSCFTCLDGEEISLGDIMVQPFSTSHDAVDPIGITCYSGRTKAALMTDTGMVSETMREHLQDSNLLVLEANYDEQMLKYGPYPFDLKRRVGGRQGHLCNEEAMKTLESLRRPKGMKVIFAHRSENNNALPIVDLMATQMLERLESRGEEGFSIFHGDPKEIVSI